MQEVEPQDGRDSMCGLYVVVFAVAGSAKEGQRDAGLGRTWDEEGRLEDCKTRRHRNAALPSQPRIASTDLLPARVTAVPVGKSPSECFEWHL